MDLGRSFNLLPPILLHLIDEHNFKKPKHQHKLKLNQISSWTAETVQV